MLNNYAESATSFNSNHGQTSRPTEATPKQHNIASSWSSYNSQLEGMYYGGEQAMYMGPYDGSSKHANYPQYSHQPVPTPVVKCQEACCQHFQDRYPINPAPLRYQPTQPRYDDSRQYFTDRRTMQPALSRKKPYPTDGAFTGIPDRHYSQFMGRGQFMPDSRQQMQMMRSQYPMYPPYWGSTRGYGTRMNCPPPPYHQSVTQGAQLQAGLKIPDAHYMDPTQKSLGGRHRTGGPSTGSEIMRPVPETKRSALDPNLQSCYEFGYAGGFVPFGEVNKISGTGVAQNGSSCKIPGDKQFHPHQMQYPLQASDRSIINCSNPINDLSYSMNFPLPNGDPYIRAGLDEGQTLTDSRKTSMQYDSSLGKKRPDLDLRQYLATWEDDEEEGTRLTEPVTLGNNGAPYIVVDCRSLEGEAAVKIQERFKTVTQNCNSKSRGSSPNGDCKRSDEQNRPSNNAENSGLPSEFQNPTSFAPSMPNLLNENEKGVNFWNSTERNNEGISGKSSAFQPLDCSKRDSSLDPNKRDPQAQIEISSSKGTSNNEGGNMSFDNLVPYYGDTRRTTDGGYDFVEMTERLVNNPDKSAVNSHQIPPSIARPCDPRLQQSHMGNNPSIYNKVAPRYSANNFQHFKHPMPPDSYYNFKHPMNPNKFFGYDTAQGIDPNYEYHKIASEFDPARIYTNKDPTKDPRRLFHHEIEKAVEGTFLDPTRKGQLNDCYQDKPPSDFTNIDSGQFIPPIIMKKPDLSRDKMYSDKTNSIRERMDVLNNEIQNHPEKTVLITSQNGPPEIFRVPYSPEKDVSNKDNVVTLHSGDQTKSNTITVEVPYVQQYSTLVKLSEEISRAENTEGKSKSKLDELNSSKKANGEIKKPTSFKLKRLPNSKEWAVENKGFSEENNGVSLENNNEDSDKASSCEVLGEKDILKPSMTASSLNMPSLDDFKEDGSCDTSAENLTKNKIMDSTNCANKTSSVTIDDSNKNNKFSSQLPQMAIVQPMKLNKCDGNDFESDSSKLPRKDSQLDKQITPADGSNSNQNNFDPDKLIGNPSSHLELMTQSDISKHVNFRTHKKIQSFSTRISSCLTSPSEEFLHSQELSADSQKGTYSPFHVYSDCDDFFKIDGRNSSNEKTLEDRIPSSPGVEGMFEDINNSNPNNAYQTKSCDFPDLTDHSINSHNTHFQSFSTIFSEETDRRERMDGSILQMNDKKCEKNMNESINNQELPKLNESIVNEKLDDSKKSPSIPPISLKLKLNESKKMWCIANKNQLLSDQATVCTSDISVEPRNINHNTLDIDAANELEKDLAQAIDEEEKRKSSEHYFGEVQNYTEINQLLSNETPGCGISQNTLPETHALSESILIEQNTTDSPKGKDIEGLSGNRCLTITKYIRRNKMFEKIHSFQKMESQSIKTLIFDEYGTHFPVIRGEKENCANSIVKDIIDDMISKFIPDKTLTGKNNVAHIAPFCEKHVNNQIDENEDAKNWDCNLSESVSKYENQQGSTQINMNENSIVKTTEMFIHIEKKYYQQQSVIRTVPSVNNIITKLKRPARSIFSPMSDHGKDDEQIESDCDKDYNQAIFGQEENLEDLKFSSDQNQVVSYHLEISNEDHQIINSCEQNKKSRLEISIDENSKNAFTENYTRTNVNHSANRNSTEIDDALELMGLSNTKAVDLVNNLKYPDNSKLMIGYNSSYLQESESETSFVEKRDSSVSEKNSSQSLIGIQSPSNRVEEIPSLTVYTSKSLQETLEKGGAVDALENKDCASSEVSKIRKSKVENKLSSTLLRNMPEYRRSVSESTQDEYNVSNLTENKFVVSSENKTCEYQVTETEPRLETSVIVRNAKFNKVSSKDKLLPYHESFGSDTETVYNVRNIINEVINDAVSRNICIDEDCCKKPLQNEATLDCSIGEQVFNVSCTHNDLNSEEPQLLLINKALIKTSNVIPINSKPQMIMSKDLENQDGYCVSKSVHLYQGEENYFHEDSTESSSSYFNDFKKRKWQRFYRLLFKRNYSGVNFYHACKQKEKVSNTFINSNDQKQPKLNLKNNVDKLERSEYMKERKSNVMVSFDSSLFSKPEFNKKYHFDKGFEERSPENNVKQAAEECYSKTKNTENTISCEQNDINTKLLGSESSHENEASDISVPLKDKVHFYNQKEVPSLLRRDSLKVLEREAFLREIFSPDPEIDNSECKENECPGINDDNRQESSPKLVECDSNISNVFFGSSISDLTKESSIIDSELQCDSNRIAEDQEVSAQSTPVQTINSETNRKEIKFSSDQIDVVKETSIMDNSSHQKHKIYEYKLSTNKVGILKSDSEDISSLNKCYSTHPTTTTTSKNFVAHRNQHQASKKVSPSTILSSQIENVDCLVESSIKSATKYSNAISEQNRNKTEEKKLPDYFSGTENLTLSQITVDSSFNDRNRSLSLEESSVLCQDKEIILSDQHEISNDIAETCDGMNKPNIQYCHNSNTSDISSRTIQNEDVDKISLLTGKDVLFSTTQTSDDQDDEALNASLHVKETSDKDISYDEDEREDTNLTSCQNDKINSLHDSLRNNQHMHKENFPLQCLVEAALALEHVDSKQILLNNSNFSGLYSQSDEGFVESPLSDISSHESHEYSIKNKCSDTKANIAEEKNSSQNDLTVADKEIFSKFEETNYNLRASTRIVTSSSSNIIPYSKRKYGLKSSKTVSAIPVNKEKKAETVSEKIKNKKRKNVFAYSRSKRRKKNTKDKQKSEGFSLESLSVNDSDIAVNTLNYESGNNRLEKENAIVKQNEEAEPCLTKEINSAEHDSEFKSNSRLRNVSNNSEEEELKNDFGGPLLIAGENSSSQSNIFCVHVESEKIDDYVGGLGILADNNHSLFKNNADTDEIQMSSEIPNVSIENSTSLVIIIEDLDDNSSKIQFDDNCKSESDVMLGSVRDADCSDVLTTELSVNESCICPPDIGMKDSCENDLKSKLSYGRSDDLLTTNCYEEINENIINDIGNWPFVEEEVAEFDNKSEFPNKIPEEGRKIELKCSLPWKKIFNMSKNLKQEKNKTKKNKTSRKTSGLELGPAKVEVRLKAPSSEWKVISDYHENSSPVVKVSRLILQRESDNSSSSYSEKDSEEENENKKQSSECSKSKSYITTNCSESYLTENISQSENWQPIVVLKRNKELDELTSRLQSQALSCLSNSHACSSDESKDEKFSEYTDSDTTDDGEDFRCTQSRESLSSLELFEDNLMSNPQKKYYDGKICETNDNDSVPYEKYSPTGCSNSLANEKIYSPSNPHFSPGEVYPDSDVYSECEAVNISSQFSKAEGFLDDKISCGSLISSNENESAEIHNLDSNGADQFENENNAVETELTQSETKTLSKFVLNEIDNKSAVNSLSGTDYSSDLTDTFLPQTQNSKEKMGICTEKYETSAYSTSADTSNEVSNCKLSREFVYYKTKKPKRKMPKNFFVRKKVRRNQKLNSHTPLGLDDLKISFETQNISENSPTPKSPSIAPSELQTQKHTLSEENKFHSENNSSFSCDNSHLNCVFDLKESSPRSINETSLLERFEEKNSLRNRARGLKRPGEGHSREDTKRRRKKRANLSNFCHECDLTFKNKVDLTRHNAYKHATRRELHHCLLCQRSFSSAARHSLHVQGRSHRHLELTQRHTMHTIHRMLAGQDCPAIVPLSRAEVRALQWRPCQPGYTHVYHDTTPLSTVLQEQNSELSEDTVLSEEKIEDD